MTLTYILVDFENVQPTAQDIALVRGEGLRLWIFRGPGQKKYSADVAEAWQPLGDNVNFIPCAKPGRNALDMHIAFYVGRLIGEHQSAGTQRGTRFVVVSKDTDYDPLLIHIREVLGCTATRVTTIKAALSGDGAARTEPRAAKSRHAAGRSPVAKAAKAAKATHAVKVALAPRTAHAARTAPATKVTRGPAAKKVAAKKTVTKASAPPRAPAAKKVTVAPPVPDAKQKVIDSLRRMGEKRPNRRKGLEHHIESHLGRKLAPGAVPDVIAALERDGVLTFNDKKVEYKLPKERK